MIDNPLVSIIICTKSRIGTLKSALENAMSQTYKNNEIIVILSSRSEDNSSDFLVDLKSQGLIKLAFNKGNRIDARNMGLRIAKGDYVCFLDDDDAMLKNRLEVQVKYLNEHDDVGAVACSTMIDSTSAIVNTMVHLSHIDIMKKLEEGEDIDTIINFQSCMFRRSAIEYCYGDKDPFDQLFIAGGEGQFMIYDMIFNHQIHFANTPYTIYLYHVGAAPNSLTANIDPVFYNENLYNKNFEDKFNFVTSFYNLYSHDRSDLIEDEIEEIPSEEPTEAPKKRGRKKKEETIENETPTEAPKKRGRKKKEEQPSEEPTEAPKKRRGRPKKTTSTN